MRSLAVVVLVGLTLLFIPVTPTNPIVFDALRLVLIPTVAWTWESGIASWYGPGFHGRRTSSGEVYDQDGWTCACRHLPLGSWLVIRNPANGREAVARVTDRGPYVKGRHYDLSRALAAHLGLIKPGIAPVEVAVLRRGAEGAADGR
jgi:rare lipoprotein A